MGLDLGLEQARWECAFANESDKTACQTIRLNRPNLNLFECDIRDIHGAILPDGLDLIVGGPPCQAFSTAGKRLGLNDERGNVFLRFIDIAVEVSPHVILIENVRGLLSAALLHRPHAKRGPDFAPLTSDEKPGGAFAHIMSKLQKSGYSVAYGLLDTADFGVPQRRKRVIVLASKGERIELPKPPGTVASTLSEALNGLQGRPTVTPFRNGQARFLRTLLPGQNWRDLPHNEQREAMGKAFDCTGGRTGFLRRLAWNQPSPTLMTSPTMPATLLAHPVEDRPLSVQEYARIQTFPDDWVFAGTVAQQYRQIGNAVPVAFGRMLGEHVRNSLLKSGWERDGDGTTTSCSTRRPTP